MTGPYREPDVGTAPVRTPTALTWRAMRGKRRGS